MATVDKNQAVITFLQTCPYIVSNPLFFNFGNVEDNAHQAIVASDDVALQKPFIDGSVAKRLTISIDSFKSVAYNPIVSGLSDENLEDYHSVQNMLDWINAQDDAGNFPTFGTGFLVERMQTLTANPELVSVDTTLNPPMAVYRVSIQIDYIDSTKKLWQ